MENTLPFKPSPKARANLRAGSVYAIDGGDSHVYFGQIALDKTVGFFKYRSTNISNIEKVLERPLMSRFGVNYQSIGLALRAGNWLNLGKFHLNVELSTIPFVVQWPFGTLEVTIWRGNEEVGKTKIHDPKIQNYEVISSYDAVEHVAERLRGDFEGGNDAWQSGGPVWRMRLKKEKLAERFPSQPGHALPEDWVYV